MTCMGIYSTNDVYCVKCIWKTYSHLEAKKIALDTLEDIQNINWCGELYDPEMREHHLQRIQKADMSYAIFTATNGVIIDGSHRVHKAYLLGVSTIKAIVLSEQQLQSCLFV